MGEFSHSYLHTIHAGNITLKSNVLMAPLAGYTCYPFRMMCRELGAGLAFTEMVSADSLKYNDNATRSLLFTTAEETPSAVQLLGGEPSAFEHCCKSEHVRDFDIIDINMGCPVPNIIKSGSGCALMGDMTRASKIIEACKRSGKIVTVKFRLGLNEYKILASEFAKMCEDSGADMITIHARTRNMMYDGDPLYEHIASAKSAVNIPVIANGGIYSEDDAVKMMQRTEADGIMLARYGFENPLIFSALTGNSTDDTQYTLIIKQLDIAAKYYDELFALRYIKKLCSYFMKKRQGTKQYKSALYRCGNYDELKEILGKIFLEETENGYSI